LPMGPRSSMTASKVPGASCAYEAL
jgi:hypothetical protein